MVFLVTERVSLGTCYVNNAHSCLCWVQIMLSRFSGGFMASLEASSARQEQVRWEQV